MVSLRKIPLLDGILALKIFLRFVVREVCRSLLMYGILGIVYVAAVIPF